MFLLLLLNAIAGSNLKRKWFVWLTLPSHRALWKEVGTGTQAGMWETGTEAETMKELLLLDCFPCISILCYYITQDHLPKVTPTPVD